MSIYNNSLVKQSEKISRSLDDIQIINDVTQLHSDNRSQEFSQDFLNEIVKEMCNLYNEERLKGKCLFLILDTLEEFLIKEKQNPANIIKFCFNNQTNPVVQNIIAACYHRGKWVEKDEHKAFIFFQKSADMGNNIGICGVGLCYLQGSGVEKDEHKAFNCFQKSAEMGDFIGIYWIGVFYYYGIVVEKDVNKAFIYYQKSAEMGNACGIYMVGNCFQYGIGVEKDEHKAFIYYQNAAEIGDPEGISKVAECYRNGIGITRDLNKAKYWYQRKKEDFKPVLAINEWVHISEISEIENELKKILIDNKYQLSWISFDEFEDIKVIGKGGFATVYFARLRVKLPNSGRNVALKLFHESNNNYEKFISELKAYYDIGLKNPTFLKCFGISKDKDSKDYILVMDYASKGCLRKNLHTIAQMDWKDKLNLLQCIASDLMIIHSHDLIHRDLHSGNILQDNLKSAYIADLGLSITANIALKSESDGIYGILPYIAPEVLKQRLYIKESDIYSFGIIMWEILYGRPIDFEQISEVQFQLQVCKGLRPHICENVAICYADLIKKCWNSEPENRPTAKEIYDIFAEWQNDENILSKLSESDKKLLNIKNEVPQIYVDSHYKSNIISLKSINKYQGSKLCEMKIPDTIID